MRQPNPSQVTNALLSELLPQSDTTTTSSYHDVTLQTSDNHEIPALKPLLSIRSPFFSRLFYAPFSESTSSTICIDLPYKSLFQVLHFIYSDDSPILRRLDDAVRLARGGSKARRKAWASLSCRDIETAIAVIAAADYCQISVLAEWGCSVILKAVRIKQRLSCIALQAIVERGGVCDKLAELKEALLKYIVRYTPGCFAAPFGDNTTSLAERECCGYAGRCGLMHLREDGLTVVFDRMKQDNSQWLSMAVLFDALYYWGSGGKKLGSLTEKKKNKKEGTDKSRSAELKGKQGNVEGSGKEAVSRDVKETGRDVTAMNDEASASGGSDTGRVLGGAGVDRESSRWMTAMACAAKMEAPRPMFLVKLVEPSGLLSKDVLFRFYKDVTKEMARVEEIHDKFDSLIHAVEQATDGQMAEELATLT